MLLLIFLCFKNIFVSYFLGLIVRGERKGMLNFLKSVSTSNDCIVCDEKDIKGSCVIGLHKFLNTDSHGAGKGRRKFT